LVEHRKHPRIARPIEGTWRGASGATGCRIGDISLGGCFIYTRAIPVRGERTVVTTSVGDHSISVSGDIVHIDPGMGFGVAFHELTLEQRETLQRILDALVKMEQ